MSESDDTTSNDPTVAKLNVGGQTYYTNKNTLTQSSNYFKALLQGELAYTAKVNNTEIFIDRDSELFDCILTYIRTGRVVCLGNFEELKSEAEYYQMKDLVESIFRLEADGVPEKQETFSLCSADQLIKVSPMVLESSQGSCELWQSLEETKDDKTSTHFLTRSID